MMWFYFLLALVVQTVGAQRPPSQKLERLPLQKKQVAFQSPTNYPKRLLRIDPKTGEEIYYDHKPRIVVIDAKAGRYAFKWVGYDGKEKTIIFQRADAIDAVVSASISKTASGQYLYVYNIQNLPSSGEHLSGFVVQNFTSDVKPIRIGRVAQTCVYGMSAAFGGVAHTSRLMRCVRWGAVSLQSAFSAGRHKIESA